MTIEEVIQHARQSGDFTGLMDQVPYAKLLGMRMRLDDENNPLFYLPFSEKNIGNPALPALHGGVIGGFMENSAIVSLMWARDSLDIPKTIDFNIDYLRSGRAEESFARCEITRQGKRVAHVKVDCWQRDAQTPIAVARVHFLLT